MTMMQILALKISQVVSCTGSVAKLPMLVAALVEVRVVVLVEVLSVVVLHVAVLHAEEVVVGVLPAEEVDEVLAMLESFQTTQSNHDVEDMRDKMILVVVPQSMYSSSLVVHKCLLS